MNIQDLQLFIHTADTGSITRAATQSDMTTAAASAALKRLEKQLNVQLFIRSTRQLRITAEGERFLVYCRKAIANLEAGKASIHALEGKVAGELRLSAPSDLGRNLLLGWLDDVMEQHPDLSVNLVLGDSLADFYMDRVDLAIRYGIQEDSSMVAFKLASLHRVLCASPTYLERHGMPTEINDLQRHNCLLFQLSNRTFDVWELSPTNEINANPLKVRVHSNRTSNDGDAVHRWALAGKGIAFKSLIDVASDLKKGGLVQVLPTYCSPKVELNLVCPTRKQVTPAVLLIRDIFRQKLANLMQGK